MTDKGKLAEENVNKMKRTVKQIYCLMLSNFTLSYVEYDEVRALKNYIGHIIDDNYTKIECSKKILDGIDLTILKAKQQ